MSKLPFTETRVRVQLPKRISWTELSKASWFGLPGLAQVPAAGLTPKVAEAQIAERGQKMGQDKRKEWKRKAGGEGGGVRLIIIIIIIITLLSRTVLTAYVSCFAKSFGHIYIYMKIVHCHKYWLVWNDVLFLAHSQQKHKTNKKNFMPCLFHH